MSYTVNGIRIAGNWFGYAGCSAYQCKEPGTHYVVAKGNYVFAVYCKEDADAMLEENASWITKSIPRGELDLTIQGLIEGGTNESETPSPPRRDMEARRERP